MFRNEVIYTDITTNLVTEVNMKILRIFIFLEIINTNRCLYHIYIILNNIYDYIPPEHDIVYC